MKRLTFVTGSLLFILFFGTAWIRTISAETDPVQRAWQLAQQSDAYDYKSLLEQTTYPAPSVANAGRKPQVDVLGLAGSADSSAENIVMTLWQNATFDPASGIELKVEDGQTYARRSIDGQWEAVGNVADGIAPDGDPLIWFHTIGNTQQQETRTFPFTDLALTRYTFDVDGNAFGQEMGDLLYSRAMLAQPLPRGVRAQIPERYRNMTGIGEIWLDSDGLPNRMVLDLDMGKQENGETITGVITLDFANFDRSNLISVPFFGNPVQWAAVNSTAIVEGAETTAAMSAGLAILLMVGLFVAKYYHTRRFYIGYVTLIIFSMVCVPLIDARTVAAFTDFQEEQKAEQEARNAKYEEQQELQDATYTSDWNPHEPSAVSHQPSAFGSDAARSTTDDTDTDDDGLTDAEEELWETCAYVGATYCDGVVDPADTDGDGLTDGQEVNSIGTTPKDADTDVDGISDYLEVTGFDYNGETWYLNPLETDTNSDGIGDSEECLVWVESVAETYDPTASCPDSDLDGTPDVFDDDNDGDGVNDRADISPDSAISTVFDYDNGFELAMDNLTVDKSVIAVMDFRPKTDLHLTFNGHVIDWPEDTAGQIQRRNDTTFATTTNSDAQSDDDNAAYGDMRVIPMLEIEMPYTAGHYANLPSTTTAPADRVLGTAVDDWIDMTEYDRYGITFQDGDVDAGTVVAYVPLNEVTDGVSSETQAFRATMYYEPTQGAHSVVDWGAAHEYRLVWLVQMLSDACIDPDADVDTCERQDVLEVVHVYTDEWQLTGMQVYEEQSLQTVTLYEDPVQDSAYPGGFDYADQLLLVAWNLSNTLLTGYDCDFVSGETCTGDGSADVTLDNIDATIDSWSGGFDYVLSTGTTSKHRDYASINFSQDTTDILTNDFAGYEDQTQPSLLFLQELDARTVTLDSLILQSGNSYYLDFDPNDVLTATTTSMKMQTYEHDGESWGLVDIYDYIDLMLYQLQLDEAFFQISDETTEDDLEGKLMWMELFYTLLYVGQSATVAIEDVSYWEFDDDDFFAITYNAFEGYDTSTTAGTLISILFGKFIDNIFVKAGIQSAANKINPGGSFAAFNATRAATIDARLYSYGTVTAALRTLSVFIIFILTIAAIIYAVYAVTGNTGVLRVAEVTVQVANILLLVQFTIYFTHISRLIEIAGNLGKAALFAHLSSKLTGSMILSFFVFIITIIVYALLYLLTYGSRINTIEGQLALAYTIAASIVAFVNFALILVALILFLTVAWPIGAAVLAVAIVIAIIDLILIALGEDTITERAIAWITESIYETYTIVDNMEDATRLDIDIAGVTLGEDILGISVSNTIRYDFTITNTLKWTGEDALSTFKQSSFAYAVQESEADIHNSMSLDMHPDEWESVGDNNYRITRAASQANPLAFTEIGTGLNMSLDGHIYLTEGYVIPIVGCWQAFDDENLNYNCTTEGTDGSSTLNIGESLVYDILPSTLTEFVTFDTGAANDQLYVEDWNVISTTPLPTQYDRDADGLLSVEQGGVDANDSDADSDDDGLTDYDELVATGTDVNSADSDNDNLTDYQETVLMTNALTADSDGDGLSDYTEAVEGWLVEIGEDNGSPVLMRVWSDPWVTDADGDNLTDLQEYIFGFHPEVATDPSLIANIIQIDQMSVDENLDLDLWLELEELTTDGKFADSSRSYQQATCASATCPTVGVTGRHGDAFQFNGVDDRVNVETVNIDFADGDFTVAAWVKPDTTQFQTIFGQYDANSEQGWFLSLGQIGNGIFNYRSDTTTWTTGGGTITTDNWHHVAATRDVANGQVKVYVDGVEVNSDLNMDGSLPSDLPIRIGDVGYDSGYVPFDGAIDDVMVFGGVLSAENIADLADGKVNTNDLIVRPGQALSYSATITNTSATQLAHGNIVAQTEYIDPAIETPDFVMDFNRDNWYVEFANGTGDAHAATCVIGDTCPTLGADGWDYEHYTGLQFDGVDDTLYIPTLVNRANKATLSFNLKLDALPASGQKAAVFYTDSDDPDALDIWLTDAGELLVQSKSGANTTVLPGSNRLVTNYFNQWVQVNILLNATHASVQFLSEPDNHWNGSSIAHGGDLIIGPGTMGNTPDGTAPLSAALDQLYVMVDDNTFNGVGGGSQLVATSIYHREFWKSTHGDLDLDMWPSFLAEMNEGEDEIYIYGDVFPSNDGLLTLATCDGDGGACPTLQNDVAYAGYSADFDGSNDYIDIQFENQIFFNRGQNDRVVMEMYVYHDARPTSGQRDYLFGVEPEDAIWGDEEHEAELHLYVDSDGYVTADLGAAGTLQSSNQLPLQSWTKVRFEAFIDNTDSTVRLTVGGTTTTADSNFDLHSASLEYGVLGIDYDSNKQIDPSTAFDGKMDNFYYYMYEEGGGFEDTWTDRVNFIYETAGDNYRTILRDEVNDRILIRCVGFDTCPTITDDGARAEAMIFDGNDTVTFEQTDTIEGDFTLAFWHFPTSINTESVLTLLDGATERVTVTQGNTGLRFVVNPISGAGDDLGAGFGANAWSHYALVQEDGQLTLYRNGELTDVSLAGAVGDSDSFEATTLLGEASDGSNPFIGRLDDLILLPSAIDSDGVYSLMAGGWPALAVDDAFVPFSIGSSSATTASGTVSVATDAPSGLYSVSEEVEAALMLQDETIVIPVVDLNSADLNAHLPMDDVPGSTVFENIAGAQDATCVDDTCPAAGLRGLTDRALYFDGVDDKLTLNGLNRITSGGGFSAWVKGDVGTIFDSGGSAWQGIELDMSQVTIWVYDNSPDGKDFIWQANPANASDATIDYDLPDNIWTHVAVSISGTTIRLYVNGTQVGSKTISRDTTSDSSLLFDNFVIGASDDNTNFFKGYIDDVRIYGGSLSASDVQYLYQNAAPVMRFEFDEEAEETVFVDTVAGYVGYPDETTATVDGEQVTANNPAPGTDGQIGNTALFDGNGVITVADSGDIVDFGESFTIGAWVKTDQTNVGLLAKSDGDTSWEVSERVFYIDGSGQPAFVGFGNGNINSTEAINDDIWTHVLATYDKDAGTSAMFVNGIDVTDTSGAFQYSATNNDNTSDTMVIGAPNFAEVTGYFSDEMDELVVYQRAMTEAEAFSLYLREVRWYRDHFAANVRVDADNPTIDLLSSASYFPTGYLQLVVNASDVSSAVRTLEMGIRETGAGDYTWSTVGLCEDADTTVYCPALTVSAESYDVTFRAVDVVGNETEMGPYILLIDSDAPTVSSSYSETFMDATDTGSADGLSWELYLEGPIADAKSGVASATVDLRDAAGESLGGVQEGNLNVADKWRLWYQFNGLPPSGLVEVVVSAEDNVGNHTEQVVGTITLDERAPAIIINSDTDEIITQTVNFSGTVTEQPNYYGKLLDLHFEGDLTDDSDDANVVTCSACPAYVDGVFGQAASFGVTDVVTTAITTPTAKLTLAAWFYYNSTSLLGQANIVTLGDGVAQLATFTGDGLQAQLQTDAGTFYVSDADIVTRNVWNHIAMTWDGATLALFVNGVEVSTTATTGSLLAATAVTLGDADQAFGMQLDEVQIYGSYLSDEQIVALSSGSGSGLTSVEYQFVDFGENEIGERAAASWQPATLDGNGEIAQWSADSSSISEGLYELQVRTTDANGNQTDGQTAWRGYIDTLAPRITINQAQWVGTGDSAQTKIVYRINEFYNVLKSIDAPCGTDDIDWINYFTEQRGRVECYVDGHLPTVTVAACDLANNCASVETTPSDNTNAPHVTIVTESHTLYLGETVTLSGTIGAANGLDYFMLDFNETEIYSQTHSADPITTYSTWSYEWLPPQTVDFYLIYAFLSDHNGGFAFREIRVDVLESVPTAVTVSSATTTTPLAVWVLPLLVGLAGLTILWLKPRARRRKQAETS